MALTERENLLRAIEFKHPEWVPVLLSFSPATWKRYREELEAIVLRHPVVFRGYVKGSVDFDNAAKELARLDPDGASFRMDGERYSDSWGCMWDCAQDGLGGQPFGHPLADWDKFDRFQPPDVLRTTRWGEQREPWEVMKGRLDEMRKKGRAAATRIPCFFDRLHYLRGFENLLCDFAMHSSELGQLVEMVVETNMKLIAKLLELGPDVVDHHGDIGTQRSLMIRPAMFRKYLKPGYTKMFRPFREAGIPVRYSSDGNLLDIVDDLIECGVSSHDPQLSVNTLDGIVRAYKGRLCAVVDFGQEIVLMSPQEIREAIEGVVGRMAAAEGGLALRAWAIPDVPLENVEAFCLAAETHCLPR
jgi:uroporphyrinogen decarboxylase